ncbi:MAG TPA: hypothetical protein VG408_08360 [Actinomycetota bacterium]|nr:hypothetical protein [Actinomycetota bacterium]
MGTNARWKTWLVGYALIGASFALAWWNNPANIGSELESQRAWLAIAYCAIGMCLLLPPLVLRKEQEITAQKTLIITLAIWMAISMWWVGYLPGDPFGCSRVNAPDCHTNATTRWRALTETTGAWVLAALIAGAVSSAIAKRRARASGSP